LTCSFGRCIELCFPANIKRLKTSLENGWKEKLSLRLELRLADKVTMFSQVFDLEGEMEVRSKGAKWSLPRGPRTVEEVGVLLKYRTRYTARLGERI
jgi:hypothetical protein